MSGSSTFEIDDQSSVDANLSVFEAELTAMDANLAAVLIPKLTDWSRGAQLDRTALWAAMLKAADNAEEIVQ